MRGKILGALFSAVSEPSVSSEPLAEQASAGKRHVNKRFVVIAAVAAIAIIVVAVFFVPQGSADVISLGVDYSVGEKLTYALTTSLTTDILNASTSLTTDSTLVVAVESFENGIYTLNYTMETSALGYSVKTSKLLEVQESEMITALTMLPIVLQAYASEVNSDNPLLKALFDKSQAKVGDTWTLPLSASGTSGASGELTLTFVAIQDLTVEAGKFRVFRIDFSTNTVQESQSILPSMSVEVSGQSYLEMGSCKQIQSTLHMSTGMSSSSSSSSGNLDYTFTSTLTQDSKP
jgi:hypothetical protein